ncbi:MAG: carbamoyl-phosphate synthase large subunit, partial [Chloroflexi bacterium]|nr:carbamoyl-phosphate synthase large subunit [Chloroflexota bacterium]
IKDRSILWEAPEWRSGDGDVLQRLPLHGHDERLWALLSALRQGASPEDLSRHTYIDPWFTWALQNIVDMENRLLSEALDEGLLRQAKGLGFPDVAIALLTDRKADEVRSTRLRWNIRPVYKMVDTCAAEFEAETAYFYSTYEEENEAKAIPSRKALVTGSGPIRIGQGIEFDYCSVHAAWALQREGIKSIVVNSNPETVSTDFDISDRLYFEPLDEESMRDIIENEAVPDESGELSFPPSIVQFGGQTGIDLSQSLSRVNLPILGSSARSIDTASDRHLFEEFLARLGIPNPPGAAVSNLDQALNVAQTLGYPVLIRPSYVLGGRAMEIVQNASDLERYMSSAFEAGGGRRLLIDKYFEGREVEVDAVCDGERVLIPGIMEHVERAGVHSGDSMAIYPGLTLTKDEVETIVDYTTRIGIALQVRGLMNIQYVLEGGPAYRSPWDKSVNNSGARVYVIEVNPRSSRTIPFISKVTGVPMVRLAVNVMLGKSLKEQGYEGGLWKQQKLVGVKAPVFSMAKLTGVDTYLGPEMKSTGEVMGIDYDFRSALQKSLMAAGMMLPRSGSILLSISDRDKAEAVQMVKDLHTVGYTIYATEGTAAMIKGLGIPVTAITKSLRNGQHPNAVDVINDGTVDAVVNTVTRDRQTLQDGFQIRRAAVDHRIPCFTALDTARSVVESLANGGGEYSVKPLNRYLAGP